MDRHGSAFPQLVVTADDFGLSPGVDQGILEAYRRGIVRSTALLVNFPDVADSVARLRQEPGLEVGIHLNLTAGPPVLPPGRVPSLLDSKGNFHTFSTFFGRAALSQIDWSEVTEEWQAQLERGLDLGCRFTFLTSHQHVHMLPQLTRVCESLSHKFRIGAVRLSKFISPTTYWPPRLKAFALIPFAQMAGSVFKESGVFSNDSMLEIPPKHPDRALHQVCRLIQGLHGGVHELVCHPGYVDSLLRARDPYVAGRTFELAVLVDPRLWAFLESSGVALKTFRELADDIWPRVSAHSRKRNTREPGPSILWPSLLAWARATYDQPTTRTTPVQEDADASCSHLPPKNA
jgi:chitin disaccharide deacetylase